MTAPAPREPKPKKGRRDVPGPALVSFTLNPDTGTGLNIPLVVAEVGLDGPAPPGGVEVEISGAVSQLSLFVGEGETTGSSHPFSSMSEGDYTVEARLGEVTKTAVLHVVDQ